MKTEVELAPQMVATKAQPQPPKKVPSVKQQDGEKPASEQNLFAVIYGKKGRIIAKLKAGEKWPGKLFTAKISQPGTIGTDNALKKIEAELNSLYGANCLTSSKTACTLEEITSFDSDIGKIGVYRCPQCKGANVANDILGIYHISDHDDVVEVALNEENPHIGKYEAETHLVFKQIQTRPAVINIIRNKGLTWGIP